MRKNIISCTTCCYPELGATCESCVGYSNWWPLVSEEESEQIMESIEYDYCSFGLQADCSLCWKESHCKAIKEAEREELND